MNIIPVTQANSRELVSTIDFTDDQREAYKTIIDFINNPFNDSDFKRALVGPAGTGKTYLVRALIKNCNLSYSQIGLSAPTHKACRVLNDSIQIPNIKVVTLQSFLGLRPNYDLENFNIANIPFSSIGKIKIGEYRVFIVDEASMINRGLATLLEKVCKGKNCKLIYIGDAFQLSPVGEKYSPAFKGIKLSKLTQIVRQEEDNPVIYLLNLLRFDIEHKTFHFLNYISKNKSKFDESNIKGYQVCNSTEFQQIVYNNFSDEELTRNVDFAKVIGYTNNCVSSWNKFIRNTIVKDAEKSIITKHDLIISYTTIVNEFNSIVIANSEEYIIDDIVNYTHPDYQISGFLVKFKAIHGGATTAPLFILDHSIIDNVSKYVSISNTMIEEAKSASAKLRAQKWRDYYAFKENCLLLINIANREGKTLFSRDLDYGFSLTSHKSQGSTFDTALVDVNDIVFDRYGNVYNDAEEINRRLYVACSRCKNKLYLKFGK